MSDRPDSTSTTRTDSTNVHDATGRDENRERPPPLAAAVSGYRWLPLPADHRALAEIGNSRRPLERARSQRGHQGAAYGSVRGDRSRRRDPFRTRARAPHEDQTPRNRG